MINKNNVSRAEQSRAEQIFFVLSIINIIIMVLMILNSKGKIIDAMTYGESNFVDFWAHIERLLTRDNVYTDADAIFPPLLYCFLKLFSTPLSYKLSLGMTITEIATSGFGILVLAVYLLFFYALFTLAVSLLYKTTDNVKKNILTFLLLFSYPFLGCAFERGNPVIYAMVFLMLGIALKDSKNVIFRELSLICVAVSAGFKLYPALFGFIWIAEKRYKEAFRMIIYGLIAFFVPFIFVGNFSSYVETFFMYLNKNMYSKTSVWGSCFLIFGDNEHTQILCRVIIIMLIVWVILCLLINGVNWKTIALLTSTQTMIIPESYVYTYVFIAIPLIMFFNENGKRRIDNVYAVLFALVFTIPPFLEIQSAVLIGIYISWVLLLFLISIDELIVLRKKIAENRLKR